MLFQYLEDFLYHISPFLVIPIMDSYTESKLTEWGFTTKTIEVFKGIYYVFFSSSYII